MGELIHTIKGNVDKDLLEIKEVPHDHGVNTEYFLNGELVRRDCRVDLNTAKQVEVPNG